MYFFNSRFVEATTWGLTSKPKKERARGYWEVEVSYSSNRILNNVSDDDEDGDGSEIKQKQFFQSKKKHDEREREKQ